MKAEDQERRTVRDAIERLLAGKPIRSDGKLTIKSLATEAGVKRWVLTHKHTDLQDEFRERVRKQGSTPDAMRALHEKIATLEQGRKKDRSERHEAVARAKLLARAVQVLTLENDQLNQRMSGGAPNVRPIRPTTD